jgi:hypothetical protein
LQWFSASARVVAPDGAPTLAQDDQGTIRCDERTAMSLLIDSPTGGRPPQLKRTIGLCIATALVVGGAGKDVIAKGFVLLLLGVPVYVAMMWWRGRETAQDAIPEASGQAQVEAAHGREKAMA